MHDGKVKQSLLPFSAIVLCTSLAIAQLVNDVVAPLMPVFKEEFQTSVTNVSLVASAFGLGRLISDIPSGYLCARIDKGKLLISGIMVMTIGGIFAAFSNSLFQLILMRAISGIGTSISATAALLMLLDIAGPTRRGTVLSFQTSSMHAGHSIAPIIGGYLNELFGWRVTLLIAAVLSLFSLPFLYYSFHKKRGIYKIEKSPDVESHKIPISRTTSSNNISIVLFPLIAVFFATFIEFLNRLGMRNSLFPLFGSMELGLSPASIGLAMTIAAIISMFAAFPMGIMADRYFGNKKFLLVGLIFILAGDLLFLISRSFSIYTISMTVVAMGVVCNSMLSGLIAELLPERWLGQGIGVYRFIADLGSVVGPALLGLSVDYYGFNAAAIIAAALVGSSIMFVLFGVPASSIKPDQGVTAQSLK